MSSRLMNHERALRENARQYQDSPHRMQIFGRRIVRSDHRTSQEKRT